MAVRPSYDNSAIIGVGQSIYTRHPDPDLIAYHFIRDAIVAALDDAGLTLGDIDGFAISSMSIAPDAAVDDSPGALDLQFGGCIRIPMAARLPSAPSGQPCAPSRWAPPTTFSLSRATRPASPAMPRSRRTSTVPSAITRRALGYGGPNTAYALLTKSRQMKACGLEKSDYGHMAIAQRRWAAGNPFAVYRDPMTLDDYLSAPIVVDPLCRFDCVPVVAGGQAVVVSHPDRAPEGRAPVRVKALGYSFNHDHQATDGLKTGASVFAEDLWDQAAIGPDDIDVASVYDDYPAMVLAQLDDLGFIPDHDARRFIHNRIKDRRFPVNTWGGMLSAGQPGGMAGGLNGISEVTLQLQDRFAGERQVPNARLGLATGYGMTMYRYGATAGATVLERWIMTPGLNVWTCRQCGAVYFPERYLCAGCGGHDLQTTRVDFGVIEDMTTVRHVLGQKRLEAQADCDGSHGRRRAHYRRRPR